MFSYPNKVIVKVMVILSHKVLILNLDQYIYNFMNSAQKIGHDDLFREIIWQKRKQFW